MIKKDTVKKLINLYKIFIQIKSILLLYIMSAIKDPIDLMRDLQTLTTDSEDSTDQLIISNQAYNTRIETDIKQDQLNKFKNDKLSKQLHELKELESNIINKDRLIEQTNQLNEKNNKNLYTLYVSLTLSLLFLLSIILYAYGQLNNRILGIVITSIILIFTLIVLYNYNIFHFATFLNFFDNRKNLKIQETIKDTARGFSKRIQERVYGDKSEWIDENCDCPTTEDIFTDEENVSVDIKPGYFYYDKNAPKQNIVPDGGDKINVSKNPNKPIYDKIEWVNHDTKTTGVDAEDYNYNIEPNNDELHKYGKLVNESTYTVNI